MSKPIQICTNLWITSHWVNPSGMGDPALNFWRWYSEGKPYILQITSNQDCMPEWKCLLCGKYAWSRRVWIWSPWVLSWGHCLVLCINLKVINNCRGSIDLGLSVLLKKIKTKEFQPTALSWRHRAGKGERWASGTQGWTSLVSNPDPTHLPQVLSPWISMDFPWGLGDSKSKKMFFLVVKYT